MSAAGIVLALRNRYIRIFRQAGAFNETTAIVPADYGIRNSLIFQGLVRRGILVKAGPERYYLNEGAEAADRKRRRFLVVMLLVVIAIVFLLFFQH